MMFRRKPDQDSSPEAADPYRDTLSEHKAQKYDELVAMFRSGGANNPELWARSELSEDIAQAARFSFLSALWRKLEFWRTDGFISEWADEQQLSAEDRESLRKLVARAAFNATWDVIMLVDEGEGIEDPNVDWPGWQLAETMGHENFTGRGVNGLHESFISADPSGNEASDFF